MLARVKQEKINKKKPRKKAKKRDESCRAFVINDIAKGNKGK